MTTKTEFPIHQSADPHGRQILTVGQLRRILDGVADHEHVVIATTDWYVNVEAVAVPDDDSFNAVTLFPGADFDTRQF